MGLSYGRQVVISACIWGAISSNYKQEVIQSNVPKASAYRCSNLPKWHTHHLVRISWKDSSNPENVFTLQV